MFCVDEILLSLLPNYFFFGIASEVVHSFHDICQKYYLKPKTERMKVFGLSKFQIFANKRFKTALKAAVNRSI